MNKEAKKIVLPKLRFPDFREQEGWASLVLDDPRVCSFVTDRLSVNDLNLSTYVSTENMLPDFSGVAIASKLPSSGNFTSYTVDDVLMSNIRPYLRKVWRSDKSGGASNDVIVFRPGSMVVPTFLEHNLKSDTFIDYVMKDAEGVKMPRGDKSSIRNFPISIPRKNEQQKIADCLSSLDFLIAIQGDKVATLTNYKKGLLQQLFPQEGETIPRQRFPEFQNSKEWKVKKLGDLCDVLMCKRIFAEDTNDSAGVPFFKIGTLGGIPDAFISRELFEEYRSKYNYPRKGEVLVTCSGTVGKCLAFDGQDAYYQDSNIVWIDNPTLEISNEFLLNLVQAIDWSHLSATTITRIYGSDLRDISLTFPTSSHEQLKISKCLSSIDGLIFEESRRCDRLKEHKQGLLQQLIPSLPEENYV